MDTVRKHKLPPFKGVVFPAIMKFFSDFLANIYSILLGNCYIAPVEKPMYIRPKEKTVADYMWAVIREGFDVRSFQHWKNALAGHGTSSVVSIRNEM